MKREIIDKTKFLDISKRLSKGEIVHAQLGKIKLDLNNETLIPHPMEIFFVNEAVETIKRNGFSSVADIGTGSGVLAIGIKMLTKNIDMYATDISEKCIEIAGKNAELNNIKDINFLQNNDKEWLSEFDEIQNIDLIVSNPPFVPNEKFNSKGYKLQFPAEIPTRACNKNF